VSGHAAAGELLTVFNLLRPRNLMPVHGEWRHLRAAAALAQSAGIPENRIMLADDGVVVDLTGGGATITGAVPCGFVYVDGLSVGDVSETELKDRRILGEEGFVSVFVVVDSATGKLTGGPEIHARGFAEDDAVFDEVRALIEAALTDAAREGVSDLYQLRQVVRRTVGRWVSEKFRRRPMIVPVVVEV
jgi:ribonuclease J